VRATRSNILRRVAASLPTRRLSIAAHAMAKNEFRAADLSSTKLLRESY
jgi:hypothetical protein